MITSSFQNVEAYTPILVVIGLLILLIIGLVLLILDRKNNVRRVTGYLILASLKGESQSYKLTRRKSQRWDVSDNVCGVKRVDIELKDEKHMPTKVFISIYGRDNFRYWYNRPIEEEEEVPVGPHCRLVRSMDPHTTITSPISPPSEDPLGEI